MTGPNYTPLPPRVREIDGVSTIVVDPRWSAARTFGISDARYLGSIVIAYTTANGASQTLLENTERARKILGLEA